MRAAGGGPVADVGCGPGRITALLREHGLDAFGIDLSPAMIELARRDHPDVRFEVGSMTDLDLPDASVAGLIAWYSLIHIPDDEIATVLAHFHRVLRPGGRLIVGFHVGDGSNLKTEGYGGHPMKVYVHKRQPDKLAAWLSEAGFTVEAHMITTSPESRLGGTMVARRPGRLVVYAQAREHLLQLVGLDQHVAGLRALRRADDAAALHQVHQPARLGEPDPQLALQHRRRPELAGHHQLGGLDQQLQVVADVLVDLLLAAPAPAR